MNTFARLVAWHRAPNSAALPWANPMAPLPPDMRQVLKVAAGDAGALAGAKAGTDADGEELRAATLRFIREVLLAPSGSYYRKLGVEPNAPIKRIRDHYRELISIFHPDRMNVEVRPSDADLAASVNEAYNALKHPESRARYNRLQRAGAAKDSSPAAEQPPFHASPPSSRATRASAGAPHWRWTVDKRPGALRLWFGTRSPSILKAMALLGVLFVALIAVLLAGGREPTTLAVIPRVAGPHTLPAATPRNATIPREVPLAALLERGGPTRARVDPAVAERTAAVAGADVRAAPAPAVAPSPVSRTAGLPASGAVPTSMSPPRPAGTATLASAALPTWSPVVVPPTTAPSARATAVPEAPPQPVIAPTRVARADGPPTPLATPPAATVGVVTPAPESAPIVVAVVPAKIVVPAPALPPAAALATAPMTQVAAVPAPIIEPPAAPPAAMPPSATEVDALVARFARAYDAGDLAALLALVDPDVAQDDRIAFTFANFSRVFRETSSRRIELEVLHRTQDDSQARIQLAARTTVSEKATGTRAGAGELTLVVRKRGGVPVIVDVRYRERTPAV